MPRPLRPLSACVALLILAVLSTACSRAQESAPAPAADQGPAPELRLGFFPNITHAAALIAVNRGFFTQQLGTTKLATQTFNAGPEEVNALLGGSLDAGFIGSGPAINAYKQNPAGIRLIAGATSGGAQLVVRPGITTPQQLLGHKIATPQLGNTQDIAFKKWLKDNNLPTGTGPGAVEVVNTDNSRLLDAFRTGAVDGGWVPEPYASRLVLEGGAQPLLDERTLWPGGQFPTTVVIARTQFLQEHPATVTAMLRAEKQAVDLTASDPAGARTAANTALGQVGSKPLAGPVLDRAWSDITVTLDPLAGLFPRLAQDAVTAGVSPSAANLAGFVDLGPLNQILTQSGAPPVDPAGLDRR